MPSDANPALIAKYLEDELGVEPSDIENDNPLFTSKLLSSMDIVRLVSFLEVTFGITIEPLDVSFELFDRFSLIIKFVEAATSSEK